MADSLTCWAYRYYIEPIIYDTSYNPVDTTTWAIVLGLSIMVIAWLFKRMEVSVDERLVLHTLAYIPAGASLRVVEDAQIVPAPWAYLLITPLIFFLVFVVAATALLLARRLLGAHFYWGYSAVGLLWAAINLAVLSPMGFKDAWAAAAVLLMGSTLMGFILLIGRASSRLEFLGDRFNLLILYAHMLDASSTYIGVDWLSYHEKHVVPTYLIDLTGSVAVMVPVKLMVLLPALYMVDRSLRDHQLRNLTKLALITLGLAPAIRNTLRMALGI
ncbi:MAG: DUF63 family protein [Methanothrix sp.]|nr:DUF63 family protein [Methanothrix sp.]